MIIVTSLLLLGAAFLESATRIEAVPIRESLTAFPNQIDGWTGRHLPIDEEILSIAGVDDYASRFYVNEGSADRRDTAELYIGYYGTQREGDTIHSPLNCLPGSGWAPRDQGRLLIDVRENGIFRMIEVNRYVIEKGLKRLMVLYWYQSHGRVVASEYWGKAYLMWDSIQMNRSDAAIVRVITSIADVDGASEVAAEQLGVEFIQSIFPLLDRFLPA